MMPEIFAPRFNRTVGCVHGEAFQIMLYASRDGAEKRWIWNSRDGVTPFGCTIDGIELQHAMGSYRDRYSGVLPGEPISHVFVDYTRAAWEMLHFDLYHRHGARPDDAPYGGKDFRERFPTVSDWVALNPYQHGQPRLVTTAEFLAETPSWVGGYPDHPRFDPSLFDMRDLERA